MTLPPILHELHAFRHIRFPTRALFGDTLAAGVLHGGVPRGEARHGEPRQGEARQGVERRHLIGVEA